MNTSKDILMNKLATEYMKNNSLDTQSSLEIGKMKKELNNSYVPKKKKEAKESTGSGSAGAFVAPLGSTQETTEEWSEKYKKSIDCKNPKGFSQKAHCQGKKKKLQETLDEAERTFMAKLRDLAKKYDNEKSKGKTSKESIESIYNDLKDQYRMGIKVEKGHKSADPKQIVFDHLSEDPKYYTKLKKVEATEATGASSAGQYSSPSFLAKSMSPKKWRGKSKTQIPGGKFVEVKKKCKKFPYCNQGDINALSFSEERIAEKVIDKYSKQYNISENIIRNILISELKNQK